MDMTTILNQASQYWETRIIEPFQRKTIARKIMQRNPEVSGPGVYSVKVNTLTGMGEATIGYEPGVGDLTPDQVKITPSDIVIPAVWKDFEVKRKQLEAWANRQVPLDSVAARYAATVVAQKEDLMLIQGWDPNGDGTYEVLGIYGSAANDFSTSKDFATAGHPTSAVSGGLALIEADYALADAYHLLLNPVQRGELRSLRSAQGVREEPELVEILNPNGGNLGQIWSTPAITAGTGLLVPVDPVRDYIEFYNPEDVVVELGVDPMHPKTGPVSGRVSTYSVPHTIHGEGLSKLSAI